MYTLPPTAIQLQMEQELNILHTDWMQRPEHIAQGQSCKPPGEQDGPNERGDSSAVGHHGQQHPDHEEADDGAGDHPRDQGAHLKHSGEVP